MSSVRLPCRMRQYIARDRHLPAISRNRIHWCSERCLIASDLNWKQTVGRDLHHEERAVAPFLKKLSRTLRDRRLSFALSTGLTLLRTTCTDADCWMRRT